MSHMAAWIAPSLSISIIRGWAIPTRIYRNNSQLYIIQVFEFPLKIFSVLGAALLYYYWLILQELHHSAAEPDKSAQTLHIDRRPKIWILFSKDYGNSLGKSQQQAPRQINQRELTWAVLKTQLWLFAKLWCPNWQLQGKVCHREFPCQAAVPVAGCPIQCSRSIVMPSPPQCWTGRLDRIQNIW